MMAKLNELHEAMDPPKHGIDVFLGAEGEVAGRGKKTTTDRAGGAAGALASTGTGAGAALYKTGKAGVAGAASHYTGASAARRASASQGTGGTTGAGAGAVGRFAETGGSSGGLMGFSDKVGKVSNSTLRDISFRHEFGRDIEEAREWLNAFQQSRSGPGEPNLFLLHQAWDIYHKVYKRISLQLKMLKKIELGHVSPALTRITDLSLAVPGTYLPAQADGIGMIHIQKFSNSVDVISSKQRPRTVTMVGSDGNSYRFLLKGNEDLRQDERVSPVVDFVL